MATMNEIAKKAGVSQATVSRVINGSPSVSPETKALVMEWVRKLDFQPNQAAKALVSNRSHLIGLVLPDVLNPYFTDIIYHVEKIAAYNGFNILFSNSDGDVNRELEIMKGLRSRQVEGLLIGFTDGKSLIKEELRESPLKTVVITQDHAGFDCVAVSHVTGGQIAAGHLIESGCDRFIFQGNVEDGKYKGFIKGLKEHGVDDSLIEIIDMGHIWYHTSQKAYNNGLKYLEQNTPKGKTGVFAYNDFCALGFMNAARDLNRKIPEDYSIVGFDDTYICQAIRPMLTSISQPKEEIGRIAINLLLDKIDNKLSTERKAESVLLAPSLVRREST